MAIARVRPEPAAVALLCVTALAACNLEVNIHLAGDADSQADEASQEVSPEASIPAPPPPIVVPSTPSPPAPPSVSLPPVAGVVRDALWRPDEWSQPQAPEAPQEVCAEPTFTPFTVAPAIVNRAEVVRAMGGAYPGELAESAGEGTLRVYFCIDDEGRVLNRQLDVSSGIPALDAAGLEVAEVFRFRPAKNRDVDVTVWVSFPISFRIR